jgi:hypothetical protein
MKMRLWTARSMLAGVLLFSHCVSHYYLPVTTNTISPDLAAYPRDRIALVGFRSFQSFFVSTREHGLAYEATLLDTAELQEFLGIGTHVSRLSSVGRKTEVDEATIRTFVASYLRETGPSGAQEVAAMFEKADGRLYLRDFNVDYFLVGVHGPPFQVNVGCAGEMLNFLSLLLTSVPVVVTGYSIPFMQYRKTQTTILVYDSKLNLVKRYAYNTEIWHRTSWWGEDNPRFQPDGVGTDNRFRSLPPAAYFSDLVRFREDFQKDVLQSLQTQPAANELPSSGSSQNK